MAIVSPTALFQSKNHCRKLTREKCKVWKPGLAALLGDMKAHTEDLAFRSDSQNHINKAAYQEAVLDSRGIPRETKNSPDSWSEDTVPPRWVTGLARTA